MYCFTHSLQILFYCSCQRRNRQHLKKTRKTVKTYALEYLVENLYSVPQFQQLRILGAIWGIKTVQFFFEFFLFVFEFFQIFFSKAFPSILQKPGIFLFGLWYVLWIHRPCYIILHCNNCIFAPPIIVLLSICSRQFSLEVH